MGTEMRVEMRARAVGYRARGLEILFTIGLCAAHPSSLALLRAETPTAEDVGRRGRLEPPTPVGPAKAGGSGVFLSGTCSVDADCDDGLACTNDLCNPISGQCENATNIRQTICRPNYLETAPGFQCGSACSGDGTEPCVPGVDPNILGRLGFECPKRYTFHNVLEVDHEVRLTTWALGDFSSPDQFYSIHLVGTPFTEAEIYKVGQLDCTSAAPHVSFTISAADWNAAIQDPGSGVGDVIFEITASLGVFCGDCAFEGGVHLEFELQACDDDVACTEDLCIPVVGCVHAPDNGLCDDGLFCNGSETCDAALDCVVDPESLPNCDDGLACTNDICNDVTDSCENALFVRETICRPGYLETEPMFGCGSACSGDGTEPCAVGGDPRILGRLGIDCPKRYTFFDVLPVGNDVQLTTWAKGNYSGVDRFYNIHLVGTSFTEQGIYLLTGQDDCSAAPLAVNFTIPAADFNAAVNDASSGPGAIIFEITASTAVSCSDCAFNGGVHLEFELQPSCDDGLFCNGVEMCDNQGICLIGSDPCIDPLLSMCDEATAACVECLIDADCDDGDFCNGPEVCAANACQPGAPPDCDDGNVCTDDTCGPATGCVHANNAVACADGTFCNGSEICSGGLCQTGIDPCPGQLCDELADACVHCLSDADCGDGLFCDGVETCDGQGNCQPGMVPCTNPLLPFCDDAIDTCVDCLAISDVTGDQVVDLIDVRSLPACMTGPVGPVVPSAYPPGCRCFDAEQSGTGDGDVDLADVQAFQQRFGGG